jgi:uncharacterized protein YnzC (UPF0291/DUF896 family)
MKEFISLSNQEVHFKKPLFEKYLKIENFAEKMKKQLMGNIQIIDDEGRASIRLTPQNSQIEINIVHLIKTDAGIGVVFFVKAPLVNGMYYYQQGDIKITRLVDPNFGIVAKTVTGESVSIKFSCP